MLDACAQARKSLGQMREVSQRQQSSEGRRKRRLRGCGGRCSWATCPSRSRSSSSSRPSRSESLGASCLHCAVETTPSNEGCGTTYILLSSCKIRQYCSCSLQDDCSVWIMLLLCKLVLQHTVCHSAFSTSLCPFQSKTNMMPWLAKGRW